MTRLERELATSIPRFRSVSSNPTVRDTSPDIGGMGLLSRFQKSKPS